MLDANASATPRRTFKIVHIYGSIYRMHGAPKWLMAFASALQDRGHDSRILCLNFQIPRPYWLTAQVIPYHREMQSVPNTPGGRILKLARDYFNMFRLASKIPDDTDVLVFHAENSLPAMLPARVRLRRARRIYYCYQPPREVYDLWPVVRKDLGVERWALEVILPVYRRVDKCLVHLADDVLVWSAQYRRYATQIYGQRRFWVVPAGVDFAMFDAKKIDSALVTRIRATADYVLLMNASLTRKKNIHLFIQLIHQLASSRFNVRGIVVGEGPLQEELNVLTEQLGIQDQFLFAGYVSQEDLPHYYFAADLLYYLEPNGAWTMSVIEAGAAERPVIAAPGGSIPTLVCDGETGYILSSVNATDELFARTVKLLQDENQRTTMGQRNREHCSQFSLDRAVDSFLEVVAL